MGYFPQSRMASSTARTSRDIHISQACDLIGILRRTMGFQGREDTLLIEFGYRFLWVESFQYARWNWAVGLDKVQYRCQRTADGF
jgi:hypothetical protein